MGRARSVSFTTASIFMILSCIGGLFTAIIIAADKFTAADASVILTIICIVALTAASILDLISGIGGIKSYNKRTNSEVVIRLPKISITLIAIGGFAASLNGIFIWQVILLLVLGVIVPIFFIFSAIKKSN